MKKFLILICGFFFTISSFAQYSMSGSGSPITPPTYNQALTVVNLDSTKAFFLDCISGDYLSANLPGYGNVLAYNSSPVNVAFDFLPNGDAIGIQMDGGTTPNLYLQDFSTSTSAFLGTVSGITTHTAGWPFPIALAYDVSNDIMYLLVCEFDGLGSSASFLYNLDVGTLTATFIGQISGVDACMTLAYNNANQMLYTHDISSNALVRINPLDATSTVIGNLPFVNPFGYFCESDFNDQTNELIFSLLSDVLLLTEVWNVNLNDATATKVAEIPGQLLIAIKTTTTPVPFKWYYCLILFMIPAILIVRRRFF